MVANKFDSRIIVDGVGAEKLLGRGDMLFSAAWNPFPVRIQGAFVDDEEIEAITAHLKKKYGEPQYIDDEVFIEDEEAGDYEGEAGSDPLFERALEIVVSQGKASASYIQRRLKIGYNRSARLVEEMEQRGIVGPAQGSKPREIIHIPKGSP
jgi:S-DNA-T family DNA segregation ATPase FtsK/SpoIIIE